MRHNPLGEKESKEEAWQTTKSHLHNRTDPCHLMEAQLVVTESVQREKVVNMCMDFSQVRSIRLQGATPHAGKRKCVILSLECAAAWLN